MTMKYAISVRLVSMSLPLFFSPNSPDKSMNSPDKSASSPDMTLRSPHLAQKSPHFSPSYPHWPLNSPHLGLRSLHLLLSSSHLKALPPVVLTHSCMEQMPTWLVAEKMKRLLDYLSRVCWPSQAGFLLVQPSEVCHA